MALLYIVTVRAYDMFLYMPTSCAHSDISFNIVLMFS